LNVAVYVPTSTGLSGLVIRMIWTPPPVASVETYIQVRYCFISRQIELSPGMKATS